MSSTGQVVGGLVGVAVSFFVPGVSALVGANTPFFVGSIIPSRRREIIDLQFNEFEKQTNNGAIVL